MCTLMVLRSFSRFVFDKLRDEFFFSSSVAPFGKVGYTPCDWDDTQSWPESAWYLLLLYTSHNTRTASLTIPN